MPSLNTLFQTLFYQINKEKFVFVLFIFLIREKQEEADAEKPKEDPKKKVWEDKKERWSHDKFNDQEQAPKSRSELVSIYGYDIRNEDGPPRARRRRRYGYVFFLNMKWFYYVYLIL